MNQKQDLPAGRRDRSVDPTSMRLRSNGHWICTHGAFTPCNMPLLSCAGTSFTTSVSSGGRSGPLVDHGLTKHRLEINSLFSAVNVCIDCGYVQLKVSSKGFLPAQFTCDAPTWPPNSSTASRTVDHYRLHSQSRPQLIHITTVKIFHFSSLCKG